MSGFSQCDRFAVGGEVAVDHGIQRKLAAHPGFERFGLALHLCRIVDGGGDGTHQCGDVIRGDQLRRLRAEDFRDAADIGRNDRKAGGGGFEHHIRQRLGARRNDKHPPHREGPASRTMADKAN